MIRRSGVSAAVCASNTARVTPRRSAAGHKVSRQALKLAAAVRMASAVISGCPEEPDSPLHSGAPGLADAGGEGGWAAAGGKGVAAGVTEPVVRPGILNGNQLPSPACARTGAAMATVIAA